MADKKITELQLISSLTDSVNVPVDNGIQTYRATLSQFFTYIRNKLYGYRVLTASGTIDPDTDEVILYNPAADITQNLPALSAVADKKVYTFKNCGLPSDGYAVTLTAAGSDKIDQDATLVLNSYPTNDSAKIMKVTISSTARWVILP